MSPLRPLRFLPNPPTLAIVGCPFRGGQPLAGVDNGPAHLLHPEYRLEEDLKKLGWTVNSNGLHHFDNILTQDDPKIDDLLNPRYVSKSCQAVKDTVGRHVKEGRLPVTLGGDHSLAMGTITGTLSHYPNACVIWIDAHADINTKKTTTTGNMHGMPVSFLMGLNPEETLFNWVKPTLRRDKIVYIGLRDVDDGEKEILKDNGVKAFSMHEVDKYGIGMVVEMALDHVNPKRDLPIHLSFDVDALDPSVAPSTGTPVRGGLTFREGHYICETIFQTGCLVAFDLVEVNPSLKDKESAHQTVKVGCSLTRAALGETLL